MSRRTVFTFRLYVAGDAQNSLQARANLAALCEELLQDRHVVDVVDVFKEPRRALEDGIFLTPTLVKMSPQPTRRIVGTLSHRQSLLEALGLVSGTS